MTETKTKAPVTRIHARVNGTSGLPEASGRVCYSTYNLSVPVDGYREHNGRLTLVQKGNVRFLYRPLNAGGRYIPTATPGVFVAVGSSHYRPGLPPNGFIDIRRVLYFDEGAYHALAAALDDLLASIDYGRLLTDAKNGLRREMLSKYNALQASSSSRAKEEE